MCVCVCVCVCVYKVFLKIQLFFDSKELEQLTSPLTMDFFHAKMGKIKDSNGMDLTKAENIKKKWQGYKEELYKKYLHDSETTE